MNRKSETVLWLHNIRSIHNVGSIFRTADAAGVSKIFLVGTTPAPVDRFGRTRRDLAKVALGAQNYVKWESAKSAGALLARLKHEKFKIIAVEQSPKAIDYKKVKAGGKTCFVFGSEVGGLPKSILSKADIIAEIPMRGKKESLNVSVAAGIALYGILKI